jgi:hypothetical protein
MTRPHYYPKGKGPGQTVADFTIRTTRVNGTSHKRVAECTRLPGFPRFSRLWFHSEAEWGKK